MQRMISSVQSWVEEHKLTTIGAMWAAAAGSSVAFGRRSAPRMAAGVPARGLAAVVLVGGAALMHHYYSRERQSRLDFEFYSQLPPATGPNGEENERWSW